jgi:hypothetical protein
MNAQSPALVASRPERLRLVGQRRQLLAVMHQRLMFAMLLFAGLVVLIVLRILWLAAFGDHAGRKVGVTQLIPDRGDIVDRDGQPLARTIDAWTIAIHPTKVLGDKLDLARALARLMPERSEAQYFAMLRSKRPFFYLRRRAAPGVVAAVNALGEPGLAIQREPDRLTWGLYKPIDRNWTPSDAELKEDPGVGLRWWATDAERRDDVGYAMPLDDKVSIKSFPFASYLFVDTEDGVGDIVVAP